MFDSNQRARIISSFLFYSSSDLLREKNSSSAVARRNLKVDELFRPVSNDFFGAFVVEKDIHAPSLGCRSKNTKDTSRSEQVCYDEEGKEAVCRHEPGKKIAISNEIGNEHRSEIKKREKKKEISVSKFSRDSRKREEEIISLTRNRRRTVYIYICMRYRETCRSPSLSLFLSLSVLFVFHRLFFHFHVSRLASTTRGLESSAPRSDALSNEITNARGGMKTTSMGVRLVATFKARWISLLRLSGVQASKRATTRAWTRSLSSPSSRGRVSSALQDDHRGFRRQLEDKRPIVENNLLSGRQYIANEPPLSDTSDSEGESIGALIFFFSQFSCIFIFVEENLILFKVFICWNS